MNIKKLTPNAFRQFGHIIHYPQRTSSRSRKNLFRIVLRERKHHGWRIAYLVVRERMIARLERHPHTFESFEPVRGASLLYVARRKDAQRIACFRLDAPVILSKGIWHGVVALGREAEIKITENAYVRSEYWPLGITLNSHHSRSTR